jgi:hypothetical protein
MLAMKKWDTKTTDIGSDHDRRPWVRTIGMVLADASLSRISDGEFNVSYLAKYPHGRHLNECCHMAVEELAEEPYEGRVSCARVMGRAMELLREIHGVNAPRGWVPVLRTLRWTGISVPSPEQDRGDSEDALDDLGAKLYGASRQVFTGKDRAKLGALLEQYPAAEIEAAWGEFIADRNAYRMKFAPKDFVEGGGERIILVRRQREKAANEVRERGRSRDLRES